MSATHKQIFLALLFALFTTFGASAQENNEHGEKNTTDTYGRLTGGFQFMGQYYRKDEKIKAKVPVEEIGLNGYFNLMYQKGKFYAGIRYEAYLPPLLGYSTTFYGKGIANRFAMYRSDDLEVTIGNFYEQFGSGILLRSLEERYLGIDNSFDGFRLKYYFKDKAKITMLYGKQRNGFNIGEGIVRAADGEVFLHNFFKKNPETAPKYNFVLGGSYVSKYQDYLGSEENIPLIVDAYSGRLRANTDKLNVEIEYAFKHNDPAYTNSFKNLNGETFAFKGGFTGTGYGFSIAARRLKGMDFRSDRNEVDNRLLINFVNANTRQHTYRLLTLYPYATQLQGETSFQADLFFQLPRGSKIGGKYGTDISFNFANVSENNPDNNFAFGEKLYFRDFNVEINRKWSNRFKTNIMFATVDFNQKQIIGTAKNGDIVKAQTFVVEGFYKFGKKKSVRFEAQHISTKQDLGNWYMGLLEFGLGARWFVFVSDEVNYYSFDQKVPVHYFNTGFTYVKGGNRIAMSYGRVREGFLCVGGICRLVPASTGLSLTVSSTF
jgi:hypothetical protein